MKALWLTFFLGLAALSSNGQAPSHRPDSTVVAIAPQYDEVGEVHRLLLGESYRSLWALPVKMRVFYLEQEKGGLQIIKRGGGMQTKSLRLQDASGKEWVLRSVQKEPEKALPPNLRATIARDILQDQISSSHPYAALTVPPLASALQIPHANPEIVFVPDDPALGAYQQEFANQVFIFEEREPITANDTDNTAKVLEQLQKDNDNAVDQQLTLRARLLDMLMGDWDRHEDQWRWEERKGEHGNLYLPVPRDRDQVYFITSGLIPWFASSKSMLPKFQGFHADVRDINGFNFNARYFDRLFLHALDEAAWREEIRHVQATLTTSLLTEAVKRMPANAYAISGEEITQKLIARRDKLEQEGLKYYRFLSEEVDIPGSDKQELIQVAYEEAGKLTISLYKIKKDGSRGHLLYKRTFLPAVTKEVRIYGRDGEDRFEVEGTSVSPIKVRLIGGDGNDIFQIEESPRPKGRLLVYDQSGAGNSLPPASSARLKISRDTLVNHYNPRSFVYDKLRTLITAGYNLDDGLFLGAGVLYTKQGFRKSPFAARHRFLAGHALATNAFFVRYAGDFTRAVGPYDLGVALDARAPNNTSNFFGKGNESVFTSGDNKSIRYYRTRYDFVTAQAALSRSLGRHWRASAGLAAQYYNNNPSDNTERFITVFDRRNPEEAIFSNKLHAGLIAGLSFDSRNNHEMPTRGVHWQAALSGMRQLNASANAFGQLTSELSFYVSPGERSGVTLANRFGGGTTLGGPAFYQLLYLGGNANLRGYRNFRFAGEHMAYHNLELHLKLFHFTSYLFPGTVGLIGFHDLGRVWAAGESSSRWHNGYGGGFYLIPAELVMVQATMGISEENVLPHITLGYRF